MARPALALVALVALVTTAVPAKADYVESVDTSDCVGSSGILRNTPTKLSGSFTCGSGATAQAFSDITSGKLGARATSGSLGRGTGEAEATLSAVLVFLPHQNIPITTSMQFTGAITGGQASGPTGNNFAFQAAVDNGFLNFGVTGVDGPINVKTSANGRSGIGPFANATVTETDTSLARGAIDITLTESSVVNTGSSGDVVISAFLHAQEVPAVLGVETTVDFLDPASFTFSVPAGTPFTFDGFLEAPPAVVAPVPEPSSLLVLGGGLLCLRIARWRSLVRGVD